jgi:putative zinc finger protein
MPDCLDVDLRDLLPDFAAERLSGADRARVAAHVATCVDCAAEVELLRAAAQAIRSGAPAVDVGRIVAALPQPPGVSRQPVVVAGSRAVPGHSAAAPSLPVARRATWTAWRMAAVLSTVAVGGLSVVVLRDMMVRPARQAPSVAVAPAASASSAPSSPSAGDAGRGGGLTVGTGTAPAAGAATAGASTPVPAGASGGGLAVAGGVSDLTDGEVAGLLQDLDGLDATPSEEPEPAAPGLHAVVSP